MKIIEDIKKLNSQQKIYFSITTTFFILLILLFVVIIPSLNKINEMGESIKQQKIDLEEKNAKGQSLKLINKNLKIITPKAKLLEQSFLVKGHEIEFVTNLEQVANQNNIKININLGEVKKENTYDSMVVKITASGSFNNAVHFLSDLETSPYYINIESIEMTVASDPSIENITSNATEVNINLNAKVFWK